MIFFFDNRNFDSIYVKIGIDSQIFGYAFLRKNSIIRIDLPENLKQVRLSFSYSKYSDVPEIFQEEVSECSYTFPPKTILRKYKYKIDKDWKFPYDCLFYIPDTKKDYVFLPVEYTTKPLYGGIYYIGYIAQEDTFVNMSLIKNDISQRSQQSRRRNILKYSCFSVGLVSTLLYSLYQIFFSNLSSYNARGMCSISIATFFTAWYCISVLMENVMCQNSWKEKELIEVYDIFDEKQIL